MIIPGFPGILSFFQVFQVVWEPYLMQIYLPSLFSAYHRLLSCRQPWRTHHTNVPSHHLVTIEELLTFSLLVEVGYWFTDGCFWLKSLEK